MFTHSYVSINNTHTWIAYSFPIPSEAPVTTAYKEHTTNTDYIILPT